MATWAMRQRYAWIDARLAAGEPFNRQDIVEAFTVTRQTASATVREYQALQPDALRYCSARKAFVRADAADMPNGLSRRQMADVMDALRRLVFAARTTGGTVGPDSELMAACHGAEQAIAKATPSPTHASDCALHNEPALTNGPCDCGADVLAILQGA